MLVSAILSATISYHSYFKVHASCLCQLYAQMKWLLYTNDSIENTQILTVKIVSTIATTYNFGMLLLRQVVLLFNLAINCIAVIAAT